MGYHDMYKSRHMGMEHEPWHPMSDSDERLQSYSSEQLPSIVRVCGRYRVKKLLGYGTFGESFWLRRLDFTQSPLGNVYLGRDIKMGQDVALKLEPIQSQHAQLHHKHSVYKAISNAAGIPTMHWCGREDPYNVIVLDLLGHTIEQAISKHHDISLIFSYANQMVFSFSASHNTRHLTHIPTLSKAVLSWITARTKLHPSRR